MPSFSGTLTSVYIRAAFCLTQDFLTSSVLWEYYILSCPCGVLVGLECDVNVPV